ncbi:MAG: glycosyltransferase family 4 protein [Planctomycetaceae bacterium]|nr:glycosyltransferase family 4 protein [Planctomycetaceae bacterium]
MSNSTVTGGDNGIPENGTIVIAAHAWFGEVFGGAFRVATELAEFLASEGASVVYLCTSPNVDHIEIDHCNGVERWRYPEPTGHGMTRWRHHMQSSRKLFHQIMQRHAVSAVVGHSPLQLAGALDAAGRRPMHRVYTVHSPFPDELAANAAQRSWKLFFQTQWAARIEERLLRRSTVVQTLSHFTAERLKSRYSSAFKTSVTVPGWVDGDRFQPATNRAALRHRLGEFWKADVPLFLSVRRLEHRMGLDTLLRAAALVKAQGQTFRVVIAGDGALRGELEALSTELGLSDSVLFPGRVSEDDLPLMFAAADCFVLPTRALECFGLIVLEAYAAGIPVIASRVGAIPELVEPMGEDWLVPPDDPPRLATAMLRFLRQELVPRTDLRTYSEKFDRVRVLPAWRDVCRPASVSQQRSGGD